MLLPLSVLKNRVLGAARTVSVFVFVVTTSVAACGVLPDRTPSPSGGAAGGTVGDGTGGTDTGGTSATGGAGGTSTGSSPLANFATIHDIVFSTCGGAGCHQPGNEPPALLVDDAKLYSTLMTYVSKKCGGRPLVSPGSPDDSAFYLVQSDKCGDGLSVMPLGCVDRCTPSDYLEGVWQWIENGAPEQ